MKVLVLYSLPPLTPGTDRDVGEFELELTANGVAEVIPGSVVIGVRGEVQEIIETLSTHAPDVVFNLCEAPLGRPDRESHVVALLEWLGVRHTGSGSETLALCRRKDLTNAVLAADGIAIPRTDVFPCIVKPVDEDGSAGIHANSICENAFALSSELAQRTGPVVVQEFLAGREFQVAVWGQTNPDHVSIGETRFLNGTRLLTYTAKWDVTSTDFANTPLEYNSNLDPALRATITATAKAVWRSVRATGYIRVDMRLNDLGTPCVLDVNPNPELGPGVGVRRAVQEAGWSWEYFVRKQIEWA